MDKRSNPLLLASVGLYLFIAGILYVTVVLFLLGINEGLNALLLGVSVFETYPYLLGIFPFLPLSSFLLMGSYPASKNACIGVLIGALVMLAGVAGFLFYESLIIFALSGAALALGMMIILWLWLWGKI